jgi:copper chaperone
MLTRTTLEVKGMTCGHCVQAVENALKGEKGVRTVQVDLEEGRATVEHSADGTSAQELALAVQAEGYEASVR